MKKALLLVGFYLIVAVLLVLTTRSYAQENENYLSKMPSVEDVKKKIKDNNTYITYVKQAGTFEQLRMILKTIDGNRTNSLTDEEISIDNEYSKAYNQLIQRAQLPDKEVHGYFTNERVKALSRYSMNRSFRNELYGIFFDPEFKNSEEPLVQEQLLYGNYTPEEVAERREKEQEANVTDRTRQPNYLGKLQGIIMIATGLFLFLKGNKLGHNIGRNQFERRNSSGVEEFSSYGDMVKKRQSEGLQGCLGQISFLGGIFLILTGLGIFFFS